MIKDFPAFLAYLKRTGRMKLLPRVLSELKEKELYVEKRGPRRETAEENPSLISGWRTLENGMLTDHTGKRALLDIYQKITK